jgi:NAD(P)-dependent dehydrogenase (short-subunit alcohol dehydrogenase family)
LNIAKYISEHTKLSTKHGATMDLNFSDKIVLVAGGTGGLGNAVSRAFLEAGAKVVVTYRKEEEFAALQQAAAGKVAALEGAVVDVTDERAAEEFVGGILSRHGRVDALVNTVGGYAGGVKLWDLETKVFDVMLSLNLRSGYALARAVVPAMLKQKQGAIVNVAAKAAFDHGAGASAYAASKAAAVAMMDSLAADLKGTGIRVNSILPSIIDTAANRQAMPNANFAVWPKPEEIAQVILFLCSDQAAAVHGAAIPVYGNS